MKTTMRIVTASAVCGVLLFGISAFCQPSQPTASPAFQLLMEKVKENNEKAQAANQQAAHEDQLASSASGWTKTLHQLAAIGFRKQAADASKAASDALAEAERLQGSQPPPQPISTGPAMFTSPVGVTGTVPALPALVHMAETDDYLAFADTTTMERKIESYLNKSGIRATLLIGNGGAAHYVRVGYKSANSSMPDFEYRITALAPHGGDENAIQLVAVTLYTNFQAAISAPQKDLLNSALLEAGKTSDCGLFIDDGTIHCRSWIAVPMKSLMPTETVVSQIRMMNAGWIAFSEKAASLPK